MHQAEIINDLEGFFPKIVPTIRVSVTIACTPHTPLLPFCWGGGLSLLPNFQKAEGRGGGGVGA